MDRRGESAADVCPPMKLLMSAADCDTCVTVGAYLLLSLAAVIPPISKPSILSSLSTCFGFKIDSTSNDFRNYKANDDDKPAKISMPSSSGKGTANGFLMSENPTHFFTARYSSK